MFPVGTLHLHFLSESDCADRAANLAIGTHDWCTDGYWLQQLRLLLRLLVLVVDHPHLIPSYHTPKTTIVLPGSLPASCDALVIAHMAAIPFEYAPDYIQLLRKAEKALRAPSSSQDQNQSAIPNLQLLVGVLQQVQGLSSQSNEEAVLRTLCVHGLEFQPPLERFLRTLQTLEPDFDAHLAPDKAIASADDSRDWTTQLKNSVALLMSAIGNGLDLISELMRIERAKQDDPAREILHQTLARRSDPLSPTDTSKQVGLTSLSPETGNVYHNIQVSGSGPTQIGNSYYYAAPATTSVDILPTLLDPLATAQQVETLMSVAGEIRAQQDEGHTVLSTLGTNTSRDLQELTQLVADLHAMITLLNHQSPRILELDFQGAPRRYTSVNGMDSNSHPPRNEPTHAQKASRLDRQYFRVIIREGIDAILVVFLSAKMLVHTLLRASNVISRIPRLLVGDSITLVDALNRELSLEYDHFRHWPVLMARLQIQFRGLPGEDQIAKERFVFLPQSSHSRKSAIMTPEEWESSVFPGCRMVMSMVVEHQSHQMEACVSCGSKSWYEYGSSTWFLW